jgi:hypothetical protein
VLWPLCTYPALNLPLVKRDRQFSFTARHIRASLVMDVSQIVGLLDLSGHQCTACAWPNVPPLLKIAFKGITSGLFEKGTALSTQTISLTFVLSTLEIDDSTRFDPTPGKVSTLV